MLAGVLLKLGGYGLYRICLIFSYEGLNIYDYILVSIRLVGGVYVSFICLCQVDIKSLVAYSSVCHISLIIGGVFRGSI
jgi:NADH-ubiquinone oxidoreductase chain 4